MPDPANDNFGESLGDYWGDSEDDSPDRSNFGNDVRELSVEIHEEKETPSVTFASPSPQALFSNLSSNRLSDDEIVSNTSKKRQVVDNFDTVLGSVLDGDNEVGGGDDIGGKRSALIESTVNRLPPPVAGTHVAGREGRAFHIAEMKVVDLKAKCKELGLRVSGKKADLQSRLTEAMGD